MLKILVSVGVVAALIWWVGAEGIWARLRAVDAAWVSVAVVSLTFATLSMARRWQLVAREMALEISFPLAVREYYIAQLANSLLPGGVVGDVGRAVRVRKWASLRRAAESVIVERLLGQVALLAVLLIGLATALTVPKGIAWPVWTWGGIAICVAVAVGLLRAPGVIGRISALVFRLYQRPELLVHGALSSGALILAFYASARATGTVLPPAAWTTLIPLVLCAMLIPLSIGGWGWREGAAAALYPLVGASADAGVATGLVYGAAIIASALPAGLILLVEIGQSKTPQQDQRML
ncbi:MAG: lysylphosphatidylglycerol synthase transmembrane domain-containing protein [Pseudomonadota bacterium]